MASRMKIGERKKNDDCLPSETLKAPHFYRRRSLVFFFYSGAFPTAKCQSRIESVLCDSVNLGEASLCDQKNTNVAEGDTSGPKLTIACHRQKGATKARFTHFFLESSWLSSKKNDLNAQLEFQLTSLETKFVPRFLFKVSPLRKTFVGSPAGGAR